MPENIQLNPNEIHDAFTNVFNKINVYVDQLKKRSSDEILNGSIVNAQKMINEILPFEKVVKKLIEAKSIIESIDGNGNIEINEEENSPVAVDENENVQKDEEENEETGNNDFTDPFQYRISLLKGLIYLGGSAPIDEVLGFIKKDMKNKMKKSDFDIINDDGVERWQDSLYQESVKMMEEGLLNSEVQEGHWEIVQKGIDYLSKNGK